MPTTEGPNMSMSTAAADAQYTTIKSCLGHEYNLGTNLPRWRSWWFRSSVEAQLVPSLNVRVFAATASLSDIDVSRTPFTVVSDDLQTSRSPSDGHWTRNGVWGSRRDVDRSSGFLSGWSILRVAFRWAHVILVLVLPHRGWRLEVLVGGCRV